MGSPAKATSATVGITDYAQHELGRRRLRRNCPRSAPSCTAGKSLGTVESVKAVSDIYAPVAGEVTEVNAALGDAPELINNDPHGQAWLIKVKVRRSRRSRRPDGRRRLRGLHRRAGEGSLGLMRYLPKSPSERQEMLDAIGVRSVDDLFQLDSRGVPAEARR